MRTEIPVEVLEYLDIIDSGTIAVCEEQKLFSQFVRRVFENEYLYVDREKIDRYLSFQKYFPFDLFPWEKCLFVLHNCLFDSYGEPRFPDLFGLMGRGAGKNGYLAFEGFCLVTDVNDIPEYDIDICATSEDQAKTSFDDIYNILENPKFSAKFRKHFRWNKTEIVNKRTGSKIKYRTNNAKGKDGLRSGAVFFDEVHAYINWDNINVFTTGLGKKDHPRRTYMTTNGDVRDCVLDELIKKSLMILNGELDDGGFLPFICKLDKAEEVHDEANWVKANPSLPYNPTLLKEIRREYIDYKLNPTAYPAFMTKRMNLPQGRSDIEVTSWENILKTNKEVPDLTGMSCVCGIDFSKITDLVSAFLLFKKGDEYYGIHHSWFCNRSADKDRIKFPLKQAEAKGLLTIVDDVEVHPHLVTDWIRQMKLKYNIKKIAVDSYRYALLSRELSSIGYEAKEKKVKLVRPSDIMLIQPKIDSLFAKGDIIWGDDMMMRWFTNNTKLEPAQNGNYKYEKIEPKSRKTDGFMAFVAAMTIEEELPEDISNFFFDVITL